MKHRLMYLRKDKPIGKSLVSSFTWTEVGDAAADIYSGVSLWNDGSHNCSLLLCIVRVLVNANITWTHGVV